MAVAIGKHEDFLATHLPQLVHNAVPKRLWQPLHEVRSIFRTSAARKCMSIWIWTQFSGVMRLQKLMRQAFDAADAFTFCYDALSQPQWTVICLEVRPSEYRLQLATLFALLVPTSVCTTQDIACSSDIWLVDHAVTFGSAGELAQGLEADTSLLQRLAALMELPGVPSRRQPSFWSCGS